MRKQAFDEVKIALMDYPKYDLYLESLRTSKMYPHIQSDENIGGSHGSLKLDRLENTVISIVDDLVYRKIRFQQAVIKERLERTPSWVCDLIGLIYFSTNPVSMRTASDLVGRDRKTCKKYHDDFMERLAGDLGVIQDEITR